LALFRSDDDDNGKELRFGSVVLRAPKLDDYDDWARLRAASKVFLQPWEPKWAKDVLTQSAFKRRVRRYDEDRLQTLGYSFFIFREHDDALIGACNLSNVRRGVSQVATLGYWIGTTFARQGHAKDAVAAVLRFSFDDLHLHRVEAACIPGNEPSHKLLERSGFGKIGLAKEYLKINDIWQDHNLFAKINNAV